MIIISSIVSEGKLLKCFQLDHLVYVGYSVPHHHKYTATKQKQKPREEVSKTSGCVLNREKDKWTTSLQPVNIGPEARRILALIMSMTEHTPSISGCYNIRASQHTCPQLYPEGFLCNWRHHAGTHPASGFDGKTCRSSLVIMMMMMPSDLGLIGM